MTTIPTEEEARAALQADPSRAQNWFEYIEALLRAGKRDEARKIIALGRQKGLSGPRIDGLDASTKTPGESRTPLPALAAQAFNNHAAQLRAQGDLQAAEEKYRQALSIAPDFVAAHYNLGNTLKDLGRLDEARACYYQALRVDPQLFEAHYNLANMMRELGQLDQAIDSYQRALEIRPEFAQAHWNLGKALEASGQSDRAKECYQAALRLRPDHYKIGEALHHQNKLSQALESYRQALMWEPDHADALFNSALILQKLQRYGEAEPAWRKIVQLEPDSPDAHFHLGNALLELDRPLDAEISLRRAIALKADFVSAHVRLGLVLQDLGHQRESVAVCERSVALESTSSVAHANLLFVLNYDADQTAEAIFETYRAYEAQFGAPLQSECLPHTNSRHWPRRLRIGYVSPDFREHSVGRFLEPLLSHHDRSLLEIFAYAEVFTSGELSAEDAATQRYKSYVDHWVPTLNMSDESLAERIRADGIDILVDVAGHTAGNRLPVFARRPAPVALSWLGYGYTTGLKAIDYLLTDEASVPLGSEHVFSETPWRLPRVSYVFRAPSSLGEVSALPAASRGYVTFGTLTRAIRINYRVVRVWAEILKRVPGSRLVIDSKNFTHASMQQAMAERFAQHGIGPDRLLIGFHTPPWDTLRSIDIGLDCFPHNSGTTLFETLYMGLPFITLAGRPSVGRLGRSILQGLGHEDWLEQWCADSEEDYIDKAVALASDLTALARIRADLRPTMQRSALMDEAGFAHSVEQAYQRMFERWVNEQAQEVRA